MCENIHAMALGDVHGVLKWHSKARIIQALGAICGSVWTRCCWGSSSPFSVTLWYSGYGTVGTPANTVHTLMPVGCCDRGREWQPFSSFSSATESCSATAGTKDSLSENSSCTITHASWQDLLWPFLWTISFYFADQSLCKTGFSWDEAIFVALFWIQHLTVPKR